MSLADELQKLHELHSSGALTDQEFERAKTKLLSSPVTEGGVHPDNSSTRTQIVFDCLNHLLNDSCETVSFQSLNANSDHRRQGGIGSRQQGVEVRVERHHNRVPVSSRVDDCLVGRSGQSQIPNMHGRPSHTLQVLDGRTRETLIELELYHAS